MKRRFIPGLVLAAAFTLTNCSEQLVTPEKENDIIIDETVQTPGEEGERIPYEIFVNDPVTKTISDGNSTYWVDLATAEANGLAQDAVDRVSLFSKPSSGNEYINHGVYTYVGNKKFIGELVEEIDGTNDWYCVYPYNSGNDVTSGIHAKVVIGADEQSGYTQVQAVADSKAHIAGVNYPMYGTSTTTSSETAPIFASMNQMSALVALKIKNEAWGDIVVTNAALEAAEPIVGEFDVNITPSGLSYTPTTASNIAKLNLSNAVTIPQRGEATLYFAVKPFTAAANQSLSVLLNNSIRTIAKLPSTINFEAGTVTTLSVPVKPLEHTIESDGSKFLSSKVNCTTVAATINGKKIDDMIVIGSEDEPGSVTIKGNLRDVLNSLPLGFYASSWNGKKSVLIVEAVEATINISIFDKKLDVSAAFTRDELAKLINKSPEFLAIQPYPVGTFNESNTGHNLIVLDEEPLHKSVDEAKGNTFLTSYGITIQDIKEAIYGNNDAGQQENLVNLLKQNSAQIISLVDKMKSYLPALDPEADDYEEKLKEQEETVNALICVGMSAANCLVTLRTADVGEEGATDPRVVMWGLDIYSDEDRKADKEAQN